MGNIETDFTVQTPSREKCGNLPQTVINVNSSTSFFPEPRPAGQVQVDDVKSRQWGFLQLGLYTFAIIASSEHPNFVVMRKLERKVPAHIRLRTLSRLTSVGRDQYPK